MLYMLPCFCFSWSQSLCSMIVTVFLLSFYRAVSTGKSSSANDYLPYNLGCISWILSKTDYSACILLLMAVFWDFFVIWILLLTSLNSPFLEIRAFFVPLWRTILHILTAFLSPEVHFPPHNEFRQPIICLKMKLQNNIIGTHKSENRMPEIVVQRSRNPESRR